MSVNINQAIGEAIIQACERAGFKLWVDEGSAQVRVRDALADPADSSKEEYARAASHTPRGLPHALSSDLNNKRGSILVALRIRQAKAKAAAAAADPVQADVHPSADPQSDKMPAGVIRQPGFGETPQQPEDPVKEALSDQVTKVLDETQQPAGDPVKIPGNPSLDPTADPLLGDVSL